MLISHKRLKEFVDFEYTPYELDAILTGLGIEVEGITDYSEKYAGFFIGEVLEKEKHPNADKLSVCKVEFGQGVKTIVCGASNVAQGQKVVVGGIGALVPNGGWTIERRAVRKIESEGMICSQVELGLGDNADGIWVLPENAPVGMPFAEYQGINDVIYEIGITPNRADCLSHLGIAREIAAYKRVNLTKPDDSLIESSAKSSDSVLVEIADSSKCPRYTARVIRGVTVRESPDWLKQHLILCGQRPVNAVVDVTNYILLECGQPLHAFDMANIKGNKIICRTAADDQKFTTLDDKERMLDSSMLMICDAERPVAIGGVMGGKNSEISNTTTDILLESAYFTPSSVRRTSKKLGLQSESSYRFERGVDFDNIIYASNRAAKLITEICGGTIESGIVDVYPEEIKNQTVTLRYGRVNDIIGTGLSPEQIDEILTALNFSIVAKAEDGSSAAFSVPTYRVDISLEIDLIEEIARMHNYDNIIPDFSVSIDSSGMGVASELSISPIRSDIREFLVANGFNEILTQNQTDPKSASLFTDSPITISNPLGEELSIMRPSLFPAMLRTIERNNRLGNFDMRLFESGKTFNPVENQQTFIAGILERQELLIAVTGNSAPMQWTSKDRNVDFYDIRGIAENLLTAIKIKRFKLIPVTNANPVFSSNTVEIWASQTMLGYCGEIKPSLLKQFDVQQAVYAVEINLDKLYKVERREWSYTKVSPFPKMVRDLAFVLDDNISAAEILGDMQRVAGQLAKSCDVFDVYKGKGIPDGKKSMAFSISYSSTERTLTDSEVEESVNKVIKHIEEKFKGELRR
jgi:phenylalanyl-tRNA synthetase beta chain